MADDAASQPTPERCDSCGDSGDLTTVRRVYVHHDLTPQEADRAVATGGDDGRSFTRAGELERWCPTCRTLYLHDVDAVEG
ncbi:MAG TPA: hypothetical protein VHA73_13630 [Acidimicrobiales bacterium]|jgi:hypothetical protein|nr:hypothetical protein [Acidimicrobiales bacterium]